MPTPPLTSAPLRLTNPGSRAGKPDLDWSQVQETISMLCLAMAQIEASLTDSSKSINQLTHAFVQMAQDSVSLSAACAQLDPTSTEFETARQSIVETSAAISQQVGDSAVAFQFYDRLTQKLQHVNESLSHLGELINDRTRLFNPDEWVHIQQEIAANYTMECERLMFDLIMSGTTVKEALERYQQEYDRLYPKSRGDEDGGVEFF